MESNMSYIEIKNPSNPASLLHEWVEEAKECGGPVFSMTLATANRSGEVSSRTVVLREIMQDAVLSFSTQINSKKVRDITENPRVGATILLNYFKNSTRISKQVSFCGQAVKLSEDKCKEYFEKSSVSAKVRAWVCQDGGQADWNVLREKYDALLKATQNGKVLEMPNTFVSYKIIPHEIDFYFTEGAKMGDRILFQKNGNWKHQRLMP